MSRRRVQMAGEMAWHGRPPLDLLVLLGVLFGTFVAQFFAATAWIPFWLRLGPAVWESWALWQLATYPLVGFGAPDFWFVIELVILFFFARDVRRWLGARRFWLVTIGVAVASGVASVAAVLMAPGLAAAAAVPFQLMQGQRLLLAVMLAAFGALAGDATIYLFFVLPVRARFLPAIGLVLAFVAFLASRDLAGLVGIVVATVLAWTVLLRGGLGPAMRRLGLRAQRRWAEWRLARLRRRRGFRVLDGGRSGPTIH